MSQKVKILIIRFSSIGDIVLATPVLRALHTQLGAEVHFVCKKAYASLLDDNPYVEKVHVLDNSMPQLLKTLKAVGFDVVIDLHKNLRSLRIRLSLRVRTYSFRKLNIAKYLYTRFKVNRLPDIHIVDRYLAAVEPMGVKSDGLGLDYFIPEMEQLSELPGLGELATQTYLAFAIGATHATKRLPDEQLLSVCLLLDMPVVLLGGKDMADTGKWIAAQLPKKVWNTCGQLNLHQSASIIQKASAILTHDTGMMHIAAALQKPIVSVWGNTVPAFGMYPYYGNSNTPHILIEKEGLSCRPCSKIGYAACPKGHFDCMRLLQATEIVAQAKQLARTSIGQNG